MKNSRHGLENPNARFRKESTVDDVLASPIVADPLRLLDICATSDGGAAMIVSSMDFARSHLGSIDALPRVKAVSTVTPRYPQTRARAARLRHRLDRGRARARPRLPRLDRVDAPTRKPASGPTT